MDLKLRNGIEEKVYNFLSGIIMPAMSVLFLCTNTVLNKWMGERAETIQNLIAIIVVLAFAVIILSKPKERIPQWLRMNYLVVAYLVVRIISLWKSGFDYSVGRTVFFEIFYLVGICFFSNVDKNKKIFYVKFFVWFEFLMTFASLAVYYICTYVTTGISDMLIKLTYFEKSGNALAFSNPNTAGIFAGFGIVLAIVIYGEKIFSKKFTVLYGMYNAVAMILFGCRSADMGVLAVIFTIIFFMIFRKVDKRKFTVAVLLMATATLIPIYGLVHYGESSSALSYTPIEIKVDSLSTGRYIIWKECVITQKNHEIFGHGNLNLEQQARKEFISGIDQNYYWRYTWAADLGPHNGYIAMVSGTGWAGLTLFIAILFQRIMRTKNLRKDRRYLILIFTFIINCFESLFILNRFFTCFYMLLILNESSENDDKEQQLLTREVN